MSNRRAPGFLSPRTWLRARRLPVRQPKVIDLGNGYKAMTYGDAAVTIVNTEKDRRLAGKKRRLARKAARRGEA